MSRSRETFGKKNVRQKQEKKRKDKEKKRLEKKEGKKSSFEDMIAYVDEFGRITDTPPDPTKKTKIELEDIEIGVPKKDKDHKNDYTKEGVLSIMYNDKGFGFINDSEGRERYFVHISEFIDDIEEGDTVSFEVVEGLKGLAAVKVTKVK